MATMTGGSNVAADMTNAVVGEKIEAKDIPGALNAGWDMYFEWAEKNHSAWSEAFKYAEQQRIDESQRWRDYYKKVYSGDWAWWKKITMFALNGIQLWALWKQFRQQKEIADRTYEVADRQQKIAEELFDFYKNVYYPHEIALGNQINNSTYCADYEGTGDRFENNVERAFARARADMLSCSGSICRPFSVDHLQQWEVEKAQHLVNARNNAYRYEETRKETKDNRWLEVRFKYIQIGKEVSRSGQEGFMKAFGTFSAFGADPGAALSRLLGTFSNTVGQMISSPVAPQGNGMPLGGPGSVTFAPFLSSVRQTGDVQVGKHSSTKIDRSKQKTGG